MVEYSALVIFVSVFVHLLCGSLAEEGRSINSIDNDVGENFGFGHCDEKDTSISCQSIRIARNVLHQLIKARKSNGVGDFKIVEGVELVSTQNLAEGGRSLNDGSIAGKLAGFLENHELRVKLPDLLGRDEMKGVVSETLRSFDEQSDLVETGRKKGGKGGGGGAVMLMGMMMAKTLAAIGFGGLGLLTMKALMVSALALMLSAIIGVKKLASSGESHDSGHQVHYVQAHGDHHRRKRMADNEDNVPLPYRGWAHLAAN